MRNSFLLFFLLFFSGLFLFSSTKITSKIDNTIEELLWSLNLKNPIFHEYSKERDAILTSELGLDIISEDQDSEIMSSRDIHIEPRIKGKFERDCRCVPKSNALVKCIEEQSKTNKYYKYSTNEPIKKEKFNEIIPKHVLDQINNFVHVKKYKNTVIEHSYAKNEINGDIVLNYTFLVDDQTHFSKIIYLLSVFDEKEISSACFNELFGFKMIPKNVVCDKYTCSFYQYEKWSHFKKLSNRDVIFDNGMNFTSDNIGNYYYKSENYIKNITKKLEEKAKAKYSGLSATNMDRLEKIIKTIRLNSSKILELLSQNSKKYNMELLEYFKRYFNETFYYIEVLKSKPILSWRDDKNFKPILTNLYDLTVSICVNLLTGNVTKDGKDYLIDECCPRKAIEEVEQIINSPFLKPVLTPGISTIKACDINGKDDWIKIFRYRGFDELDKRNRIKKENDDNFELFIKEPKLNVYLLTDFLESIMDKKKIVKKCLVMPEKIEIKLSKGFSTKRICWNFIIFRYCYE